MAHVATWKKDLVKELVDDRRRGSQNLHAVFLQVSSQIQWSLSAKLCDHTKRFLFIVNT